MTESIRVRSNDLSENGEWYTDAWSEDLLWSTRVTRVLRELQTEYQHLRVLETAALGRMLVLDGAVQVAERDEAGYHELIVHPGLCRAGAPENDLRVLIVGGGDGGAAREVLRHPGVTHLDLVDIDPEVTRAARDLMPTVWQRPDGSGSLDDDPRLHVHHEDGMAYVARAGDPYDLIIVDSTDPEGPGEVLFSERFYRAVRDRLTDRGAVSVQAGSWFFLPKALVLAHKGLSKVFEVVAPYSCWTAIYPGGQWNLILATTGDDPTEVDVVRADGLVGCQHYDAAMHRAAFALSPAARDVLSRG